MGKAILTIVIPVRYDDEPTVTLDSLDKQSFQDYKVIISYDEGKGANYARNKGFKQCDTEYVLFSDNDIRWEYDGIQSMIDSIGDYAYSYGSYEMGGQIQCFEEFDAERLKQTNFISTMSVIKSNLFVGFDESLKKFQDWDLWLNMLSHGLYGKQCGKLIFRTDVRNGITNTVNHEEALQVIKNKWKLSQTI